MTSPRDHERLVLRWPAPVAVLILAAFIVLVASPWAGADAKIHRKLRDFDATGKYQLSVDGETLPEASIYQSRRAAAILVVSEAFDTPILLSPRTKRLDCVAADALVRAEGGRVHLGVDTEPQSLGSFTLRGGTISFRVKGKRGLLQPKPHLIGPRLVEGVLQHTPEYGRGAKRYKPSEDLTEALREQKAPARVRIFFGSWCPTCTRYVPYAIKLNEMLRESNIGFRYHGLPRPPAMWRDAAIRATGVRKLPTGIIYVRGREVGRIVGKDWAKAEVIIQKLIKDAEAKRKARSAQ